MQSQDITKLNEKNTEREKDLVSDLENVHKLRDVLFFFKRFKLSRSFLNGKDFSMFYSLVQLRLIDFHHFGTNPPKKYVRVNQIKNK